MTGTGLRLKVIAIRKMMAVHVEFLFVEKGES